MKKGFTLIELLIVVIILGILATIAIPQFGKITEKAKRAEADSNIAAVETAEAVYYLDHDNYTSCLDDLDVDIVTCHWTIAVTGNVNAYNVCATRVRGPNSGQTYIKMSDGTVTGTYNHKPGD